MCVREREGERRFVGTLCNWLHPCWINSVSWICFSVSITERPKAHSHRFGQTDTDHWSLSCETISNLAHIWKRDPKRSTLNHQYIRLFWIAHHQWFSFISTLSSSLLISYSHFPYLCAVFSCFTKMGVILICTAQKSNSVSFLFPWFDQNWPKSEKPETN